MSSKEALRTRYGVRNKGKGYRRQLIYHLCRCGTAAGCLHLKWLMRWCYKKRRRRRRRIRPCSWMVCVRGMYIFLFHYGVFDGCLILGSCCDHLFVRCQFQTKQPSVHLQISCTRCLASGSLTSIVQESWFAVMVGVSECLSGSVFRTTQQAVVHGQQGMGNLVWNVPATAEVRLHRFVQAWVKQRAQER